MWRLESGSWVVGEWRGERGGGKEKKGKKTKKPIIPAHNMEVGNKFIKICKDKGFKDADIAKRYLITEFNNIKTTTSSVDEAYKIFQSITSNDKAAMFNSNGNLDENLVILQFVFFFFCFNFFIHHFFNFFPVVSFTLLSP